MHHTEIDQADMYSPCQEFSNGRLEFVVGLTVFLGIDFSCAYTGTAIQLYLILLTTRVVDIL